MSRDDSISLHCSLLFPQQMLQNMPPQGSNLTDICQNLVRSRYNVVYDKERIRGKIIFSSPKVKASSYCWDSLFDCSKDSRKGWVLLYSLFFFIPTKININLNYKHFQIPVWQLQHCHRYESVVSTDSYLWQ